MKRPSDYQRSIAIKVMETGHDMYTSRVTAQTPSLRHERLRCVEEMQRACASRSS
jgi:hypothetical protein